MTNRLGAQIDAFVAPAKRGPRRSAISRRQARRTPMPHSPRDASRRLLVGGRYRDLMENKRSEDA